MTNFEKYKDEIIKIVTESQSSPAMKDGAIVSCMEVSCKECDFGAVGICGENRFKWFYEDDGEEPDGCDGCKYEHEREDESPCVECSNNYTSKWERRPKKTRQDEFLEMFPEARRKSSVLEVCPRTLNVHFDCKIKDLSQSCVICCQDYWLQEVEE